MQAVPESHRGPCFLSTSRLRDEELSHLYNSLRGRRWYGRRAGVSLLSQSLSRCQLWPTRDGAALMGSAFRPPFPAFSLLSRVHSWGQLYKQIPMFFYLADARGMQGKMGSVGNDAGWPGLRGEVIKQKELGRDLPPPTGSLCK